MGGGFLASLFGSGDKRPRCPPSGGNPSNLAGKRVDTEEDVLHLSTLPTFDGLLRPSESELLLTYLTAPYLRIPLVLRHFADPQRVRALGRDPSVRPSLIHTIHHTDTHTHSSYYTKHSRLN